MICIDSLYYFKSNNSFLCVDNSLKFCINTKIIECVIIKISVQLKLESSSTTVSGLICEQLTR